MSVSEVSSGVARRVRVFCTGQGRQTDATDAHSIAVVALRTPVWRAVQVDGATVALRLLGDRRDELGAAHVNGKPVAPPTVRRRVPTTRRRPETATAERQCDGLGRTSGVGYWLRRGRLNPNVDASEKSLPGPADLKATPAPIDGPDLIHPVPDALSQRRPAAVVKRSLLDNGEDRRTIDRRERDAS